MKLKLGRALGRRAACIALTAAMGATFVAGNLAALAGGSHKAGAVQAATSASLNFEEANGKVNLDAIKLANMNSRVMENRALDLNQVRTVIVSLEGGSLSEYTSDYSAFVNTAAGRHALEKIKLRQTDFLKGLEDKGIRYCLLNSYDTVINAVAIEVNIKNLTAIKKMEGVATVSVSSTYARPEDAPSSGGGSGIDHDSIYANGIYNSSAYTQGTDNPLGMQIDGRGMTVAILDTGIDYTHEAFADDVQSPRFTQEYIDSAFAAQDFHAEQSGSLSSDVYVSSKIPFAYDYADHDADVYPSYSQHGTHVAGIVAGKAESYTDKNGYVAKDEGGTPLKFRGVAPEAQLVICKVFTDDLDDKDLGGAETQDILSALEDCCKLGVDVINMSLGTSSGFPSSSLGLTEADSEGIWLNDVYEHIRGMGISLMVAASNEFSSGSGSAFGTNLASNPDSGTVGSPSTFSGAMSVASINGLPASYLLANATIDGESVTGGSNIYYEESRNEDSDAYNFVNQMLGGSLDENDKDYNADAASRATFKYVVVPGTGELSDYTSAVVNRLKNKGSNGKVIAVIKRGGSTFKQKLIYAKANGADAAIVYNNVSGMIRMSLGDMEDPIPSISVSMDAGAVLTGAGSTGTITIDRSYTAGPFMNEYSSWGTTPNLDLKPDVTSHGGEITSTVAGGYDEMSGTSMACPNLAGFTALLRSYLKDNATSLYTDAVSLTKLTNNIMMSTATVVYDHYSLPYSPRKQGAGLATLNNVFTTKAYLYTKDTTSSDPEYMCEDGRPKAELHEDEEKTGEYTIYFSVKNFGDKTLKFKAKSLFFTETLGADGLSVAERAHLFTDSTSTWKVGGVAVEEGQEFEVAAGTDKKIEVTLKLGTQGREYLKNFKNGMYVEGFLQLIAVNNEAAGENQCDLSLPFMGFYGDWEAAPLLDINCFQQAAYDKDTSYNNSNRPQPSVWATQPYSYYYNEKYSTPLGSYLYVQDEDKEHTADYVYTDEEHIVISCYNEYNGENATDNYLTLTGIKALYAGLLRNAELVTYTLTNVDTGELVADDSGNFVREIYRVNKSTASGGSPIPSQVLLELRTRDLGLPANGKYALSFYFYLKYEDYNPDNITAEDIAAGRYIDINGEKYGYTTETFDMTFYIDYEAPVLVDSRIRFQDMQDANGKATKKVYLDLDVFDNTYPQCAVLCYSETGELDEASLRLATEYVTPIINPRKNTINTLSIDITDLYEDYKGNLFVELDDYALNHNVYVIDLNHSQTAACPAEFEIAEGSDITIEKNTALKLTVNNMGDANVSNFVWNSNNESIVKVKDGEIFGVAAGNSYITVLGGNGQTKWINVTVTESNQTLKLPTLTFGTVLNADKTPVPASGTVKVNSAQQIKLEVKCDPWYYPIEQLGTIRWEIKNSQEEGIAEVDQNGNVTILYEGERTKSVRITATSERYKSCEAAVTFSIRTPYRVSSGTLTNYFGWGGERVESVTLGDAGGEHYDLTNVRVLKIPNDKAITTIGEEAFKDDKNVEVIIIPKNVTTISKNAFKNCVNLKAVCFIDTAAKSPADSSLTRIERYAFNGCTSLEVLDLSNCKVFTIDKYALQGCTSLKKVIKMLAAGTVYEGAFAGCTSLESINLEKLHVAGAGLFAGCTSLAEVVTSKETVFGERMFEGCTALTQIEISSPVVPEYAFYRCNKLTTVTLGEDIKSIGDYAFASCSRLQSVVAGAHKIYKIGDYAFRSCTQLNVDFVDGNTELGNNSFAFVNSVNANVVEGGRLVLAAKVVSSNPFGGSVTKVGDYAFSGSALDGITSFDLTGIDQIGEGAFYNLRGLTEVTFPAGITEIPAYSFYGTGLTSVTIPATVTKIGEGAFGGCGSLASITFAGNAVTEIGAGAFEGAAITSLQLPASVQKLGSEAFATCELLQSVTLPAVKSMGEGVFAYCYALHTAQFGDDATATGSYTFYTPDVQAMATGRIKAAGALKNVSLGNGITEIGEGAFAYCGALESINLNAVKTVGAYAFYVCSALTGVEGIDALTSRKETEALSGKVISVTPAIGINAFAYCTSLEEANLAGADIIGLRAFFGCTSLEGVTLSAALESIGDEAFAETALTQVNIPATCTFIGSSAFSGISALKSISVDGNNNSYFDDGGVLYRYINDTDYELCAYPAGKAAPFVNGVPTYKLIDGTGAKKGKTVSIRQFAFYGVPASNLTKVILPYSLKLIGNGAFLSCGATAYEFNSMTPPTLLEGLTDQRVIVEDFSSNSLFYNNFGAYYLADYVPHTPTASAAAVSTLTISYPSNATGYDGFIWSHYFGTKTSLGEKPDDISRRFKELMDGLDSAETVSGWTTANTTKEAVAQYAEKVKTAHMLYNGVVALNSQVQLDFITEENVQKLKDIEGALKGVKVAFEIPVTIRSVEVDGSSQHKVKYIAGEKFSADGLKLLITYDDYSTEIISADGNFKLQRRFDRALMTYDETVTLDGTGAYNKYSLSIKIEVAEEQGEGGGEEPAPEEPTPEEPTKDNGLTVGGIVGIVIAGVAILATAAALLILFFKRKKKGDMIAAGETVADAVGGENETAVEESEASDEDNRTDEAQDEEPEEEINDKTEQEQETEKEEKSDD